MNSKENECINFLRYQSENFTVRETEISEVYGNLYGWENNNVNIISQKKLKLLGRPKPESKRSRTPGLTNKNCCVENTSDSSRLTSRDYFMRDFLSFKKDKIFNDSSRTLENRSSVLRKKARIVDSVKIYQHCTKNPDFSSKKHIIIHTILPDKCRISGTVPSKCKFLKCPVRINTKKYFILESSL